MAETAHMVAAKKQRGEETKGDIYHAGCTASGIRSSSHTIMSYKQCYTIMAPTMG